MSSQLAAVIALSLANFCLITWVLFDKVFDGLASSQLLLSAVILGLIGVLANPLLEDDHFRYLWDGYITATTGEPFAFAPSHYFDNNTTPAALRDILNGVNNPELPTIYGPLLQALFALCYWIAPAQLWPLKGVLLIAEVIALLLLRAAGVSPRWLLLLILHPLVIKESAITAHPDLLVGVALLAAVLAWRRGLEGWAAVLACAAVALKFSAVVAIPLFCISRSGRWSARGIGAIVLTLGALYAPVLASLSGGEGRALSAFGEQWTFNPLLFKVAATVLGDGPARWVCLTLFVAVWLILFWHWIVRLRWYSRTPSATLATSGETMPVPPVVGVFIAMLLLSPVVNPWYWLWVLPLALLHFSALTWAAATVSLLAYAHIGTQVLAGSSIVTYAVPLWATGLQMLVIASAFAFTRHRRGWI